MTAENFVKLESDLRERVDFTLFTVLRWQPVQQALYRAHSSHPVEFPFGGQKVFQIWPEWLTRCVADQRSYLGPDCEAVRAAFYDYKLIYSLGCGAFINTPVIDNGQTVAILCLLGPEHSFNQEDVRQTQDVAACINPSILGALGGVL